MPQFPVVRRENRERHLWTQPRLASPGFPVLHSKRVFWCYNTRQSCSFPATQSDTFQPHQTSINRVSSASDGSPCGSRCVLEGKNWGWTCCTPSPMPALGSIIRMPLGTKPSWTPSGVSPGRLFRPRMLVIERSVSCDCGKSFPTLVGTRLFKGLNVIWNTGLRQRDVGFTIRTSKAGIAPRP